ncbi:serine/threonine receptor-like kinase NFP [Andrographis paniculata]|uniref:serine/threonine receptor-like kinase NFP n=1 Tax=Andrographis paniculata TaxID=175694 RepID=UPI0021E7C8D6|nr:serine/threonine receptor-like kinase NFP [Andrographis paniculata]
MEQKNGENFRLFCFFWVFFFAYTTTLDVPKVQAQPSTVGYNCTAANQSSYPCETYVFYRATSPNFLDLASVGDLFSVSRLMIADPSNITSPASPLLPNQSLFVPIKCGCNRVSSNLTISYAALNHTIKSGDTFYRLSTESFGNLTTFQSVEVVNPSFVPTQLEPGDVITFPIFCRCPNSTQLGNQVNFVITYVFQNSDNISSIASMFGTTTQSIIAANENTTFSPMDTVFVPVSKLPNLTQPVVPPIAPEKIERKGAIIGLGIGLGICGLLLALVSGAWIYRESSMKKKGKNYRDEEKHHGHHQLQKGDSRLMKPEEVSLMADVSGCLDKYRVFGTDELREATDGFDERWIIQGSVYKGCIDDEWFAIKKMKWNAYEELKILQKVNHGNLVKLEGFCVDREGANCYLVYEYVENGSLHSWLHDDKPEKPSWKTRLRIAIDVANGLQYIHEHTRPKVVHKDIKSSNILLDANMRAKIANFGLAKSGCNAITMHIVGTQGYIAPEYLADGVVSTKMDVFSFGVVLLELISGREAVDEHGNVLWATAGEVFERRSTKMRGWIDRCLVNEPIDSVVSVMAVAVACLNRDPAKRPSMVEIVYALSKSDEMDVSEEGFSPRQVDAR